MRVVLSISVEDVSKVSIMRDVVHEFINACFIST